MAHLLGYARVSTLEQNPDLQVDELTAAGCWKVWTDHASGTLDRRPQLDEVLEQLRSGDTLVVWRLDRLGRRAADQFSSRLVWDSQAKRGIVQLGPPP